MPVVGGGVASRNILKSRENVSDEDRQIIAQSRWGVVSLIHPVAKMLLLGGELMGSLAALPRGEMGIRASIHAGIPCQA